ncbi:MAG: hypothetical protein ACREH6_11495, partial [Geminicoccaceae bacterium]
MISAALGAPRAASWCALCHARRTSAPGVTPRQSCERGAAGRPGRPEAMTPPSRLPIKVDSTSNGEFRPVPVGATIA